MPEYQTIPAVRRVYYDVYADLPVTGVNVGDLGFATDRLVLYRWSGAAWQALTFHCSSGTAAAIPAAANLPNGSIYFETDTAILKQVQAGAWATINSQDAGEGHVLLHGFNYNAIDAGTWAFDFAAACWGYQFFQNSSTNNLDAVSFKAYLAIGTYTIRLLTRKFSDAGIMKIKIDGVTVLTGDCYAAVTAYNQAFTQTGVTIATSGIKTIQVICDGKNGASADYSIMIEEIAFWRTA